MKNAAILGARRDRQVMKSHVLLLSQRQILAWVLHSG